MTYEVHPLANALPALRTKQYEELLADIQANGLLDPITMYEGKVLDGRNRLRACQEAGIEPRFVDYSGSDPAALVISKNVKRRHLSAGARAMAVAKIEQLVAQLQAEANERRLHPLKKGNDSPLPSRDGNGDQQSVDAEGGTSLADDNEDKADREATPANSSADPAAPEPDSDKHDNTTAAKLGKLAGVSEKSMERMKYILKHGTPEDIQEVKSGVTTMTKKAREIRARRKNDVPSGTEQDGSEGHLSQLKSAKRALLKEWKCRIQTINHTLLLNASSLPQGEAQDSAARFQRALEDKTMSKKARTNMRRAVEGLQERCQEALRLLA